LKFTPYTRTLTVRLCVELLTVFSTEPRVSVRLSVALSMRDMLQVPLGWCSSGLSAKEYTLMPLDGTFSWCW
jgi:hypothetical protein